MRLAGVILDAAEPEWLERLMASGQMPNLARLRRGGAWGRLRAPVAFRSEYSATEFLTGRRPEQIGYWSTVHFDADSYTCSTVGSAAAAPFYGRLPGARVTVFDLPHAALHPEVTGLQVVGWGGHDARYQFTRSSHPADLMAAIDARFGPDPSTGLEFCGDWHQPGHLARLGAALVDAARRRGEIAEWLLARDPACDVFLMGMPEPHAAGHLMAHGFAPDHLLGSHPTATDARTILTAVFRAVDDSVGRVAAAIPAGTVLAVFGVKGMQANRDDLASGVLLAELLYRDATGRTRYHEPNEWWWRRRGCPPVHPSPRWRIGRQTHLLRADTLIDRLERPVKSIVPLRAIEVGRRRRPTPKAAPPPGATSTLPTSVEGSVDWHPACWYADHWPSMPAFALPSFSDGHIRLNVEGRERSGVVPADAVSAEVARLTALLREVTDARTGRPVVDEVIRLDTPAHGPRPAADLLVTWREPVDAFHHPTHGTIGPFAFPRSGSHTEHGFLAATGSGLHGDLGEHRTLDLPATLVALAGYPVLPELDGRAIRCGALGAMAGDL